MNRYDIVVPIIPGIPAGKTLETDVLATPMLISEGTRRTVQAYREGTYDSLSGKTRGIWRMRDDGYDAAHAPGVEYKVVMVRVVNEPDPWG